MVHLEEKNPDTLEDILPRSVSDVMKSVRGATKVRRNIWARLQYGLLSKLGLPFFKVMYLLYPVVRFLRLQPVAYYFARRWVVGTKTKQALRAAHNLEKQGVGHMLDILGELVTNDEDADYARDQYQQLLERMVRDQLDPVISIKLSQLGLCVNETRCEERVYAVLRTAESVKGMVVIDMEEYALKDATIRIFRKMLHTFACVGICLQAYLPDTKHDLKRLIADAEGLERELWIRLCKGAYLNQEIARAKASRRHPPVYLSKEDTDRAFLSLAEEMIAHNDTVYSIFATHDQTLISQIIYIAQRSLIDRTKYEFDVLYGVAPELAHGLAHLGFTTRMYIPFGTECLPYVIRRLAKNPANLSLLKRR